MTLLDMMKVAREIGANPLHTISFTSTDESGVVAVYVAKARDWQVDVDKEPLFLIRPGTSFESAYRDYLVGVARDRLRKIEQNTKALGSEAHALNLSISLLASNNHR
jgi:hypothetical protein